MRIRRCGVDFCPNEGVHKGHGPPSRTQYFCDEVHKPTWLPLTAHKPECEGACCFYCGRKLKVRSRTKDHVIPMARGGSRLRHNVVSCCFPCNQLKGILTGEEFLGLLPQGEQAVKRHATLMQNMFRDGLLATAPPISDAYVLVRTVLAQHGVTGDDGHALASDLLRVVFSKNP